MTPPNRTRIALALVLCAAASTLPAQAADTAAPSAVAPAGAARMAESSETRIKHLHDQLKITAEEESKWNTVAQVMLNNASTIKDAVQDRFRMSKTMTAISDLKSYEAIVDAHADGIKKLATAFAPLYAAMPDAQQKHADAVFGRRTEPSQLKTHA
jgi:periplasmic protein CpxP/Spy